jgi:hypothetical protein
MLKNIHRKHLWLFLVGFSVILFIYSLFYRIPHVDDAWLGEQVYWQTKLGYVKSELMHGITQQEDRLICHHKLLTLQGSAMAMLFGFSLFTVKSVALLYFIAFLGIFYWYFRQRGYKNETFCIAAITLLFNGLIFEYAFVYRPELPLMTLGFLSYIFFERSLEQEKNKLQWAALAGFLAGLGFAVHLNGIVFLAASFVVYLSVKQFRLATIFSLAAIPAMAIYFYDFTQQYNFNFFLYQISESPSVERHSNLPLLLSKIVDLANEHMRFFHSPREITFYLLLVSVIFLVRKKLNISKIFIRYTILLIVFLAFFSIHKTTKYSIPNFPFLIIIISLGVSTVLSEKDNNHKPEPNKWNWLQGKSIIMVLFAIYLITNAIYNIALSVKKVDIARNNREMVEKFMPITGHETTIIAPMTFIFNEIENFKSIRGELCFTEMQKANPDLKGSAFLQYAYEQGVRYIILSPFSQKRLALTEFDKLSNPFGFSLKYSSDKICILEKRDD